MKVDKVSLLNRRQWSENRHAYRIGLLAITGVLLFLFLVTWHWRDSFGGDVHKGIFLIGLFGGGCIFGSSLLKELAHSAKAAWFLGLPSSAGEKVFIAIFYGIVLYLIAYLPLFYLAEGVFSWVVKPKGMPIEHTDLLLNGFYNFLFAFINFQLLVLLGSLFFKRAALLKTVLLMILLFAICYNANNYLLMLLTGEKTINGSGLFDYFQFTNAGENVYVYLPLNAQVIVTVFFHYLLPITLYAIIYLKFRETEI